MVDKQLLVLTFIAKNNHCNLMTTISQQIEYLEQTNVTGMNCDFDVQVPIERIVNTIMNMKEESKKTLFEYFPATLSEFLAFPLVAYKNTIKLAQSCEGFDKNEFEFKIQAIQFIRASYRFTH